MEDNRILTWADLDQHSIDRFRLEESGRSYAINYTIDPTTDVYRKIYYSYPYEQRRGYEPIDMTIVTTITYSDLQAANKECHDRMNDVNRPITERPVTLNAIQRISLGAEDPVKEEEETPKPLTQSESEPKTTEPEVNPIGWTLRLSPFNMDLISTIHPSNLPK
jgi:hypothetical protein